MIHVLDELHFLACIFVIAFGNWNTQNARKKKGSRNNRFGRNFDSFEPCLLQDWHTFLHSLFPCVSVCIRIHTRTLHMEYWM